MEKERKIISLALILLLIVSLTSPEIMTVVSIVTLVAVIILSVYLSLKEKYPYFFRGIFSLTL